MIKLAISNPDLFATLQKIPVFRHFFVFFLPSLNEIREENNRDQIFSALRYGDVTGKFTAANRFFDIDTETVNCLGPSFKFHDVGVSSGITSLDLLSCIGLSGKQGVMSISDKYSEVYAQGKYFVRVLDVEHNVRSIYLFRILCDPGLSRIFFLSRWLFNFLSMIPVSGPLRHIYLFSNAVLRAINDGKLQYLRYDVFDSCKLKNNFTFVRCMNLLNRCYFSDAQISLAIEHLRDSLTEEGILLLGRTDDSGCNRASFYQRLGDQLLVIKKFNGGAEIDCLVDYTNLSQDK